MQVQLLYKSKDKKGLGFNLRISSAVFIFRRKYNLKFKFLKMKRLILFIGIYLLMLPLAASEILLKEWLYSGSFYIKLPAFSATENLDEKEFTLERLFRFPWLENKKLQPLEGSIIAWDNLQKSQWQRVTANEQGIINSNARALKAENEIAYFATYINSNRWGKVTIEVQSSQRFEVFIGNSLTGTKYSVEKPDKEPGKWTKEISLKRGTHLLKIKTFNSANEVAPAGFSAKIKPQPYFLERAIYTSLSPSRTMTIRDVLEGEKARRVSLSHDGKYYAVNFSLALPEDKSETWTEIWNLDNNRMVQTFRHSSISSFEWGPSGNIYAYRTTRDNKSSIWVASVDKPEPRVVLSEVENLESFRWVPNGAAMIYSVEEKPSEKIGDLKLVRGMEDRLPGFRTRDFLYKLNLHTGLRERLTHGFLTTNLHDISPDGKYLLFSQSRPNYTQSPFSLEDMFLMNLETHSVDTIWKNNPWDGRSQFSPDGRQLLVSASPFAFDGLGKNVPEGKIPSSFDTQLFIYDLATQRIEPITKGFNPSVLISHWNPVDNQIYFTAVDHDYQRLFRYNPATKKFQQIETGLEFITSIDFSDGRSIAISTGNNISSPPRTVLINLRNLNTRTILDAEKEAYKNVQFGRTKDWNFVSEAGFDITGRVYYPPNFDSSKKYPVIVYYYAGVTPVGRTFGGRYPLNIYAADGYIVYVLQPSGAIGFGQAFSAEHVNNWGITVADEIIQGTKYFLENHPYANAEKVGCIGASYGGFMTMLLLTRTDIFAAAISHAGISSISSYWGEGFWGYSYSASASKNSYPWNNRRLYVDQSPLFNADKVVTPLLLLHGVEDTNVPVGESIQMFTALKILGRPVELVEVKDEDHHILTPSRRYAWHNTKMAWFDKLLKGEGEWWRELYPDRNL